MPLAAVAGISALGSIGSALIGSHSASSAADKQMQAAQQAANLQLQGSNNALNYQNGIYNQTQQNLAPWLQAGGGALNNLSYLLGISPNTSLGGQVQPAQGLNPQTAGQPQTNAATGVSRLGGTGSLLAPGSPVQPTSGAVGAVPAMGGTGSLQASGGLPAGVPRANPVIGGSGVNPVNSTGAQLSTGASTPSTGGFGSLIQGYGQQFTAPTDITEQNDPGYQARLKMGTDAIQRSAAARGGVLTGGTAKALDQYGQDYASNEYGNVYNRALNTFGTNYGVWNNDQNNIYSRLLGLSNSGQQAANSLGAFGQESSNNVTGNLLGTGQQIGQDYGLGGAANASGIYNSGSALAGGLNGITGSLSQLLMLKQLGLGGGGYGGVNTNSTIPGVAD